MDPLVARSEDYNYHFFRRMIENIKQTHDVQGENDYETDKVRNTAFSAQKHSIFNSAVIRKTKGVIDQATSVP